MKTAPESLIEYRVEGRSRRAGFEQVKVRVHRKLFARYAACLPDALVKRVIDEAAQTAESHGFAQLLFPLLAEEQVRKVAAMSCPPNWKSAA